MYKLPAGKKLAFIYNVRQNYPDLKDSSTFTETDFDDKETIDAITLHLKNIGFDVLPIESNIHAREILIREKENIGFVFNYSEEVVGSYPKIYMAQVLEELNLPFTGCSNKSQEIIINKGKMKTVLIKNNISTLPFQIIDKINQKLDAKLNFPVIVKPIARGSSAGITNKSIVNNNEELSRQVKFVLDTFNEPAIVEPFITGREFSVGMIGNPPEVLPIIEPCHDKLPKDYHHIDSFEVKWELEDELGESYFSCPAKVDSKLKAEIENLCLAAWKALEINDFCRMEVRIDKDSKLYVLDVNSPPGTVPPEIFNTGYLPFAGRAKGYDYENLLSKIIESGLKRYNLI